MDVDDPSDEAVADLGAQNLHVAGEDDQIDAVVFDEAEEFRIGLGSRFGGNGDVAELDRSGVGVGESSTSYLIGAAASSSYLIAGR